jgi:hypothetical protein
MHQSSFPPHLFKSFPALHSIYLIIPHLSISLRKELLTACRVQQHPNVNPRLRREMRLWFSTSIPHPTTPGINQNLTSYNRDLQIILDSPLFSSFLSMALRSESFPSMTEADDVIQVGIQKELSAAFEPRYPSINWSPLFSQDPTTIYHTSLIKNGPTRPHLYQYLRWQLLGWKQRLANRLLSPQMSFKTMGDDSTASLHMVLPHSYKTVRHRKYTTIDAEIFYAEHGYLPPGACEVRYAWKFNDLKPRIYYAQGLSAYISSRYIHDVFDTLQRVSAS